MCRLAREEGLSVHCRLSLGLGLRLKLFLRYWSLLEVIEHIIILLHFSFLLLSFSLLLLLVVTLSLYCSTLGLKIALELITIVVIE